MDQAVQEQQPEKQTDRRQAANLTTRNYGNAFFASETVYADKTEYTEEKPATIETASLRCQSEGAVLPRTNHFGFPDCVHLSDERYQHHCVVVVVSKRYP